MTTPEVSDISLNDYPDEAFMTINEVAAVMRVSKMTVYRLVKAEEIPCSYAGRSFRIQAKAVRAYLNL